jgi:hypothetical protein
MTAPSFLSAPPWSEKRRRHQGALTTRVAPSTISSGNSRSDREARNGKPVPADRGTGGLDIDSPGCPFDAGLLRRIRELRHADDPAMRLTY